MDEMHTHPAAQDRAVDRDDRWFGALYPQLHRVACVAAPADIDPHDLVQDALVRFLRLEDPGGVDQPRAFLTTTIVNLASNHRRSWIRRRAALARLGPTSHMQNHFPSDLADLLVLSPRDRAVLYLHHVEGFEYQEVAELVGCTPTAARKAAERGRSRLADTITREEKR
jgi:RNA polymerase sigma-70 factor (ECF subfamily)